MSFPAVRGSHIQVYAQYHLSPTTGPTQTARTEVGMLSLAYVPYVRSSPERGESMHKHCPAESQATRTTALPEEVLLLPTGPSSPTLLGENQARQQTAERHVPHHASYSLSQERYFHLPTLQWAGKAVRGTVFWRNLLSAALRQKSKSEPTKRSPASILPVPPPACTCPGQNRWPSPRLWFGAGCRGVAEGSQPAWPQDCNAANFQREPTLRAAPQRGLTEAAVLGRDRRWPQAWLGGKGKATPPRCPVALC